MHDPNDDIRADKMRSGIGDHFRAYRHERKLAKKHRKKGDAAQRPMVDNREARAALGGSDYAIHAFAGRVVEHRRQGFGFETSKGVWFVHAHPSERPPVGHEGRVAVTGGKRIWLAAYPDDAGEWHPTDRTWDRMFGRPTARLLLLSLPYLALIWLPAYRLGLRSDTAFTENTLAQLVLLPMVYLLWRWARDTWHIRRNRRGMLYQLAQLSA